MMDGGGGDDAIDLDDAVETVRTCARTGECGSSSACWRDEGAFKRALIAAARARLMAFGRRARGGDDGMMAVMTVMRTRARREARVSG